LRRFRFTIAGLLGLVLFVAVAFAALREATDLWDSAVFTLTLGALVTSMLLAVHHHGERRAYWFGFALFGISYLVASLIPSIESRLLTTKGLAYLSSRVPRATVQGVAFVDVDSDAGLDLFVTQSSNQFVPLRSMGNGKFRDVTAASGSPRGFAPLVRYWNAATGKLLSSPSGTSENFMRIGHSIVALIMAYVGGTLSSWLHARGRVQQRNESAPEPAVFGPTPS
jgi:hypothetical protein